MTDFNTALREAARIKKGPAKSEPIGSGGFNDRLRNAARNSYNNGEVTEFSPKRPKKRSKVGNFIRGSLNETGALLHGLQDGIYLGAGEKAEAVAQRAIDRLLFRKTTYAQRLKEAEDREKARAKQSPMNTFVGNTAGMIGGGIAAGGTKIASKGVAELGKKIGSKRLANPRTGRHATAVAAGLGGAWGGATGVVNSQGFAGGRGFHPGEVVKDAAVGTVLGAGLGVGVDKAISGIEGGIRMANRLKSKPSIAQIRGGYADAKNFIRVAPERTNISAMDTQALRSQTPGNKSVPPRIVADFIKQNRETINDRLSAVPREKHGRETSWAIPGVFGTPFLHALKHKAAKGQKTLQDEGPLMQSMALRQNALQAELRETKAKNPQTRKMREEYMLARLQDPESKAAEFTGLLDKPYPRALEEDILGAAIRKYGLYKMDPDDVWQKTPHEDRWTKGEAQAVKRELAKVMEMNTPWDRVNYIAQQIKGKKVNGVHPRDQFRAAYSSQMTNALDPESHIAAPLTGRQKDPNSPLIDYTASTNTPDAQPYIPRGQKATFPNNHPIAQQGLPRANPNPWAKPYQIDPRTNVRVGGENIPTNPSPYRDLPKPIENIGGPNQAPPPPPATPFAPPPQPGIRVVGGRPKRPTPPKTPAQGTGIDLKGIRQGDRPMLGGRAVPDDFQPAELSKANPKAVQAAVNQGIPREAIELEGIENAIRAKLTAERPVPLSDPKAPKGFKNKPSPAWFDPSNAPRMRALAIDRMRQLEAQGIPIPRDPRIKFAQERIAELQAAGQTPSPELVKLAQRKGMSQHQALELARERFQQIRGEKWKPRSQKERQDQAQRAKADLGAAPSKARPGVFSDEIGDNSIPPTEKDHYREILGVPRRSQGERTPIDTADDIGFDSGKYDLDDTDFDSSNKDWAYGDGSVDYVSTDGMQFQGDNIGAAAALNYERMSLGQLADLRRKALGKLPKNWSNQRHTGEVLGKNRDGKWTVRPPSDGTPNRSGPNQRIADKFRYEGGTYRDEIDSALGGNRVFGDDFADDIGPAPALSDDQAKFLDLIRRSEDGAVTDQEKALLRKMAKHEAREANVSGAKTTPLWDQPVNPTRSDKAHVQEIKSGVAHRYGDQKTMSPFAPKPTTPKGRVVLRDGPGGVLKPRDYEGQVFKSHWSPEKTNYMQGGAFKDEFHNYDFPQAKADPKVDESTASRMAGFGPKKAQRPNPHTMQASDEVRNDVLYEQNIERLKNLEKQTGLKGWAGFQKRNTTEEDILREELGFRHGGRNFNLGPVQAPGFRNIENPKTPKWEQRSTFEEARDNPDPAEIPRAGHLREERESWIDPENQRLISEIDRLEEIKGFIESEHGIYHNMPVRFSKDEAAGVNMEHIPGRPIESSEKTNLLKSTIAQMTPADRARLVDSPRAKRKELGKDEVDPFPRGAMSGTGRMRADPIPNQQLLGMLYGDAHSARHSILEIASGVSRSPATYAARNIHTKPDSWTGQVDRMLNDTKYFNKMMREIEHYARHGRKLPSIKIPGTNKRVPVSIISGQLAARIAEANKVDRAQRDREGPR